MRREQEEGSADERFKGWKEQAWKSATDDWLTTSAILARVDPKYAKKPNAHKQLRETLAELRDKHDLIEKQEAETFAGEVFWRRKTAVSSHENKI